MATLTILDYNLTTDTFVVDVTATNDDIDYVGIVDDFPAEGIELTADAEEPVDMIGKTIEASDYQISLIYGIG